MARARQVDLDYQDFEERGTLAVVLGSIASRPAVAGWSVASLVACGFVFSNALFFQSGEHPAAFFHTRDNSQANALRNDELAAPQVATRALPDKEVTRIVFDAGSRTKPVQPQEKAVAGTAETAGETIATAMVEAEQSQMSLLQENLSRLGFYNGTVDGISGPQTQAAIDNYKTSVGLRGIDLTTAELVTSTRNNLVVTAAIPKVRPELKTAIEKSASAAGQAEVVAYTPPASDSMRTVLSEKAQAMPSAIVAKVQGGLRAFGNSQIVVDGVPGSQTSTAIREFQSLFELPVTGTIDDALISKMEDVGLIN